MVSTRDIGPGVGPGVGGRDWLGDRACLDFVNTAYADGGDRLNGPPDLAAWLWEAGLVPSRVPINHHLYEQALELRGAIDLGVEAVATGRSVPVTAVEVVNGWMERAERQVLSVEGGTPVLRPLAASDFAAAALSQLAVDAARLLGTGQRARVRICAGGCGLRFFDHSPAGRRRWCSMQRCGNAAKARRYRAGARRTPPDPA